MQFYYYDSKRYMMIHDVGPSISVTSQTSQVFIKWTILKESLWTKMSF